MAHQDADAPDAPTPPIPTLEDMQQWTWVMGRAQQTMMEHFASQVGEAAKSAPAAEKAAQAFTQWPGMRLLGNLAKPMATR